MPRPLIAITCGSAALDPNAPNPQDRLNHAYSRAIWMAGGAPVVVPNLDDTDAPEALLSRIDGLLLSGGYDVCPAAFAEETLNETVQIDSPRDAAELPVIRAALNRDLPLFAICRGIQSLNVTLGGTLYQDIPAQIPSDIPHRQTHARNIRTHRIAIERKSRLAEAVGDDDLLVNTFHHQALKDVADMLSVTARAPDGIVEAVEIPAARYVLAVQFHPEELVEVCPRNLALFQAFVAACS